MGFGEEHRLFRGSVRRFVTEEVVPHVDEWEEREEVPRALFRRMGELGFLGVEYPAEHGGAEADLWMSVVLAEEMAQCRSGGVAFSVMVHTDMSSPWLARLGTVEQQARYLPGIVRGETVCALAITEAEAGSDMAALATRARRDGDEWVLSGSKTFITNGVACMGTCTSWRRERATAGRDATGCRSSSWSATRRDSPSAGSCGRRACGHRTRPSWHLKMSGCPRARSSAMRGAASIN